MNNTNQTVIRILREANGSLFRFIGECQDGTTKVLRARASKPYRFASVIDLPTGGELVSFHSSQPVAPNGVRVLPITDAASLTTPAVMVPMATVATPVAVIPPVVPTPATPTPAPVTVTQTVQARAAEVAEEMKQAEVEKIVASIPEAQNNAPKIPPYVSQNGEVADLLDAVKFGENALLTGPTGCGKTHLVRHVAAQTSPQGMVTIQGGDGMTPENMIGYRDVVEINGASATVWRDGLLTMAMRKGLLLYVDEPNAIPDGIRFYLFSAMDDRREVTLAENGGEVVKAASGFTVVAAMNEGAGYSGTSTLNYAFRGRFSTIVDLAYLPPGREAKLLNERTGLDIKECKKLTGIANTLRAAQSRGEIKLPVGTRALLSCAAKMARGQHAIHAATLAIINQVPSVAGADRKAVSDIFAAHYAQA